MFNVKNIETVRYFVKQFFSTPNADCLRYETARREDMSGKEIN